MLLTKTNWLTSLRDNILERQTLYPNGGGVGKLTKQNWVAKLREDILTRQTLYPLSANIGPLTAANWLDELKYEILKNQSLYPEGNALTLMEAIAQAQSLLNSTEISVDGADIDNTQFWTIQDVRDTFSNAISVAQSASFLAASNDDSTIIPALNALTALTSAFNLERQLGTANS